MKDDELLVIAVGPGDPSCLTQGAIDAMKECGCLVVAPRNLPLTDVLSDKKDKKILELKVTDETLSLIKDEMTRCKVGVMISGDAGIYSLLTSLKNYFPDTRLRVIPGMGALQALCAAANEIWQGAKFLSTHGKAMRAADLLTCVEKNRRTICYCGPTKPPKWICQTLAPLPSVTVIVGENLSYPHQKITKGSPAELSPCDFDPLAMVMIINPDTHTYPTGAQKDSDFIRHEKIPMTRAEVRSVLLDRLELTKDAIVWDIGCGSGSVSVACALSCLEVHAIDINPEAIKLTAQNERKFHLHNITTHEGCIAEIIAQSDKISLNGQELPVPTHVFIGGSGGHLPEILEHVKNLSVKTSKIIKIMVSCVSIETLSAASSILQGENFTDFDAVCISIARAKKLSDSTIMKAENPVTLVTAMTIGEFA